MKDDELEPLRDETPLPGGDASASLRVDSEDIENLGFARLDHDRTRRCGFSEVIYGEGKTTHQLVDIFVRLAKRHPNVLCTRTQASAAEAVVRHVPDCEYHARAGLLRLWRQREITGLGPVVIVAAGTSDLAVAEEALLCAEAMGNAAELIVDVGVAGLSRLLRVVPRLRDAQVVICIAGMEAALPSVVAGLIDRPVIAVPTSVGYGVCQGGWTALRACLASCSAGITVVNIDNGFGAASAASKMNHPPRPQGPHR